jgi:hypothetical protein
MTIENYTERAIAAAQRAVDRSAGYTEIVTLDHDPEVLAVLKFWAEDYTNANTVIEIWGTDEQSEWRVHMRYA